MKKYNIFFLVLFLLLLLCPFAKEYSSFEPSSGNECWWISSGNTYFRLFLKGDFENEIWTNSYFSDWSWMNPQFGKYIIGMPLHLSGYGNQNFTYFYLWGDGKDYEWNLDNGRVPPKNILTIARFPGLIMGFLTCVLIFLIGIRINPVLGIVSSLYLSFNKYFLQQMVRASNDSSYIFFLV
ncbi:hypothetical protein JW707_01405, partial [Candidatus Woesearchaeota archaeon]|nr:hypothetical protein [Candidatus Woesearchaeota archaeon]